MNNYSGSENLYIPQQYKKVSIYNYTTTLPIEALFQICQINSWNQNDLIG